MKRAALMAIVVLSAGFAAGCERNDSTSSYDPKLDGVKPPAFKRPDESILDNQKDLVPKASSGTSAVTVAPAATTTAPTTSTGVEATTAPASDKAAPATPSTGGDVTPPPPG